MSIPSYEFPDAPEIAGDVRDDDAAVINSLVESHAEPPTPAEMPLKAPLDRTIDPPKITRMISNTINIDKTWPVPTLLLPADPNRKSLTIRVASTTTTDVVYLADEQNKAQNASTSFVLAPATTTVDLSAHTGAVWIYAPLLAATALVTAVAVTS